MNRHERTQMALVYDDPAPEERRALELHLAECEECRVGVDALRRDRQLLSAVRPAPPPAGLAEDLFAGVRRADARRTRRWAGRTGLAAVVAVVVAIAAVLLDSLLPGHHTAPAGAEVILQQAIGPTPYISPSSGVAYISYRHLDWTEVPINAAPSIAPHLERIHWIVSDATHFRIDVTTIRPYVDAGTFSVIVRGRRARSYDSETGRSTSEWLPSNTVRRDLEAYLVELRFGFNWGADIPDPIGSIGAYVKQLTDDTVVDRQGRSRIVGHQMFRGHRATVIDITPATWAETEKPCYLTPGPDGQYPSANDCPRVAHALGRARIWIDEAHHAVLKYQEFGFPRVQNRWGQPAQYLFRVQKVTFGGRSQQSLGAIPRGMPIGLHAGALPTPLQQASGRSDFDIPPGFIRPPFPAFPATSPGQVAYALEGSMKRLGLDVVWRRGSTDTLSTSPTRIAISWHHGPYIYVQQRLRPSGPAPYYRPGALETVGSCSVRMGTYSGGGRWAALQRGSLVVVISSGGITPTGLRDYVQRLPICI